MNLLITLGCCIAVVFIFLLLVLLIKLKITVKINDKNIKLYLWKIKVFDSSNKKPKKEKKVDKDEEFEKKYKGFKYLINFIRKIFDDKNDDLLYILKYIKKTFSIKKLDLSLDYGFGDAAVTGVFGGIIWGLISNISGFIGKFININSFTNIAVKPHYTDKILCYKVDFVFYIKSLNLLKAYKHIKRLKKTLEGRD